jgi:hypothetical protein
VIPTSRIGPEGSMLLAPVGHDRTFRPTFQ